MEFTEETQQTIIDLQNQINDLRALTSKNDFSNTYLQNKTVIQHTGAYQSPNFVSGSAGWQFDSDGNLEAESGYFRGNITGASGTFSGALSASDISGGTITGSAISGGTITGVTITGGTIQTASSGQRVVMNGSNNTIDFHDSNGVKRGIIWGVEEPVTGLAITGDIYAGASFLSIYNLNLGDAAGAAITVSWNNSVDIGTDSYRFRNVYANNYPASPIQVSKSGIEVFKKIKKIAHKGTKYTLETKDLPKEFKIKGKKGKEHTEIKRTVGLCVQAIKELIGEVELLKNK